MSKKSQKEAKPVGYPRYVACRGLGPHDYPLAKERVDRAHPEWSQARREQRAWVETFTRALVPRP